ncbi:MAG: hypothetical protein JO200_03130 [Comamonas sp.]|nr:hypothetical protein [Comamonas sp.]
MTPTPALPMWLEVLKAVAPLIAALLAAGVGAWVAHKFGTIQAGIARQQAETAARKLKLDVFDRRLTSYKAIKAFITNAFHTGNFTPDERLNYLTELGTARWIFTPRVYAYLQGDLLQVLDEMHRTLMCTKDIQHRPDGAHVQQDRNEAYESMRLQFRRIEEVFGPDLQLQP